MKPFAHLAVLICVIVLFTCASRAQMICYDGFDYAPGTPITNLNGGTGWNGAWFKTAVGQMDVAGPGLTYSDGSQTLATRGMAMRGAYFAGDECRRVVNTAGFPEMLTNGNCFGLQGTTNWISFLARMNGTLYVAGTGWYGVNLRRPTAQYFERTVMGYRPDRMSQGAFMSNSWVAGGFGARYTNAGPVTAGQTVFYVARIIYGSPTPTTRSIALWINPSLAATPADATGTLINNWPMNYTFSSVTYGYEWDTIGLIAQAGMLSNSTLFTVDEVRVGQTYRDVAPRDFEVSLVYAPTNIAPANGTLGVPLPVTLVASPFSSAAPGDVHNGSKFSLRSEDGVTWGVETSALTSVQVPAGVLKPDTHYYWQVQYKGTNSPAWSDPSKETSFETYVSPSAIISYDGADYDPTTSIAGYNGGFGWLGSWYQLFFNYSGTEYYLTRIKVESPGLRYPPSLAVTNNRFVTDNIGVWNETENPVYGVSNRRPLARDGGAHLLIPGTSLYGRLGTTNWFSCLARYISGEQTLSAFGLELAYNPANDGTVRGQRQFMVGKPQGQGVWGMTSSNGTIAVSGVNALDGSNALLVVRIVYSLTESNATAHLWVNPTVNTNVPPNDGDAAVLAGFAGCEFNRVGIFAQANNIEAPIVAVDEIRFGNSWAAVTPEGPQPPVQPETPVNVAPGNGATMVPVPVALQGSAYAGSGPGDVQALAEFRARSLGGVQWSISTSALTSITAPVGAFQPATRYFWQLRYRGTNNTLWSDWSAETSFETAPGAPALLAYDGAEYAATTNGISGLGTGFGWRSDWSAMMVNFTATEFYQTRVNVDAPGLGYFDAAWNMLVDVSNRFLTSRFGVYSTNSTDSIFATRSRRFLGLDGAMNLVTGASNMFGKSGTTNWFSLVVRYENGDVGGFYGLELADDSSGFPQTSLLLFGKPAGSTVWGIMASNGAFVASSVDATTNATAFLVGRVIFDLMGDTAHLWVNPQFGSQPPLSNAVELAGMEHIEYSRLGIVATATSPTPCPTVSIDEIRFGTSWSSVTPYIVPEPQALLLLGLAALGLCRRARR
jgi:hypothetical protein